MPVVWEDPPEIPRHVSPWIEVMNELIANPNKWALIAENCKASIPARLQGRDFEFATRGHYKDPTSGKSMVKKMYARYLPVPDGIDPTTFRSQRRYLEKMRLRDLVINDE